MGKLSSMLGETFRHMTALGSPTLCHVRLDLDGIGPSASHQCLSQGEQTFVLYLDGNGWGEGSKQWGKGRVAWGGVVSPSPLPQEFG